MTSREMDAHHLQMLNPDIYPEPTCAVEFKETHISRIYLTDTTAYKLKKPLNLGFLDFSTLAKRHHYCREEVRLNRRFAPSTYLGVAPLREKGGHVSFVARQGKIIDYAVRMQRLPEERMLDRLLDIGAPELTEEMGRLAKAVHSAFESADICRNESPHNSETVKANCAENFAQTLPAVGRTLTSDAHRLMQARTSEDLARLTGLLRQREAEGFVRDGHGDLHSRNICMTDPICIYDCIEFNRRFRVADIAADLAFLLMDLDFRARRDLAALFLRSYLDRSDDQNLEALLPFYKRYRAWVRGKVETILAAETDVEPAMRALATSTAQRYFNLALGYLLKPSLYLVMGLMGVGKTTFSRAFAQATGASHLRSDVIRKELAGLDPNEPCRDDFGVGLYDRRATERTYATLLDRVGRLLQQGDSVIVDASFAQSARRQEFRQLANRLGMPAWEIVLECPEAIAMNRLGRRTRDASDGRGELYAQQREIFDPIVTGMHTVTIDTVPAVDYNVQSVLCRILSHREPLS